MVPAAVGATAWVAASFLLPAPTAAAAGATAFAVALAAVYLAMPDLVDEMRAQRHGYLGERQVGRVLDTLPPGWMVSHDVTVGGETADHVVVSPTGVFAVDTKNYFGIVRSDRDGLHTHGRHDDRLVAAMRRKGEALSRVLGVPVQPVLVFTRGRIRGDRIGPVAVATPTELPALLRLLATCRVEPGEADRIIEVLDAA